ncbi:resuscitation-promoting factor [Arthrobacter roseus]|uniref:resuscitation-promoting factor n=1 Tax=Arthrobacter roseus TaxID=136274 RepID=UPI0023BAD4CF|nr:resuscitation-promoting factor [Arthrobacter roseus]MBM7848018.1 uncharacterized protein YabE (DUF348 family) [Arthrobacter roseus]
MIAAQGAVMFSLVLGLVAFVGNNKLVTLTVDGRTSTVQTFGGTVGDVLGKAGVGVDAADHVTPALSAAVQDGTIISVNQATAVTVTLDGAESTVNTTSDTVGDLVAELGVARQSRLSASLETNLVTLANPLYISTPKTVALLADGKSREVTTTAETVADLLADADVSLGDKDRISIPESSLVVAGMALKITRVETGKETTKTKAVPFTTKEVKDNSLAEGKTKVKTEGVAGETEVVYALTVIDGKTVSRKMLSETVLIKAVQEYILIGTAVEDEEVVAAVEEEKKPEEKPGQGTGVAGPSAGNWAALAKCESGGNWSINSGNGYYGGLQFSLPSWRGAGGGKYAPYPHEASPAEQIATAEVLRSSGGWGHWPSCAGQLGLL